MSDAYEASAVRHWYDAELLRENGRLANANQLVGFAAECGIKTALSQLPAYSADGALANRYRKHIDELWPLILVQNLQKRFPTLMSVVKNPNPFHDWSIDHRYAKDGTITAEAATRHRDWAKRILGSVGINGLRGRS